MFRNYLLIAIRNLLKNKTTVLINTFGLGIALACCITAYILIAYNIEFDDFHGDRKVRNIYRVHTHVITNGTPQLGVGAPIPVGPMAKDDIAGINRFTRFISEGANISYGTNAFSERITFADSSFFDLFEFPLRAGSHQAFKDKSSIFLTREMATKYFGDEDPIGKVLTLHFSHDFQRNLVVGGVLEDVPVNHSLPFNALARMEHFEALRVLDQTPWTDWQLPALFVELTDPKQKSGLEPLFGKYVALRNDVKKDQVVEKFTLEPFRSKVDMENLNMCYINLRIPVEPLMIFIVLALMILLIACFNMTNTSIAMTANRLKEIGIRKSVGAQKNQIISQFLLETALTICLSLIIGLAVARLIVPEFVAMWQLPYGLEDMNGINMIIALLLVAFLASILAGIYPAIFSTRFNTVSLLKGHIRIKGTNGLTRTLVSLQFALSVIVLIGGVIFIQNTKYQESLEFGYDKDQLISISIQSSAEFHALEARAQANPKVNKVAVTDHHLGFNTYQSPVKYEELEYDIRHLGVGKNYFETVGFTLLQGRVIDPEKTTDLYECAVVSKEFLNKVGLQGDPIGQQIEVHGNKRRIVGVIDDFVDNVYRSKETEPFVFYGAVPEAWKLMVVKANPEDLAAVNEFMETAWKELYPTKPYVSRFQEDILLEGTRQTNANLKKIFLFLTILGGFLSVSGIFSLASLNIAKRTKEIGIRKTLGASIRNVVLLLNREFLVIMSIAVVLGSLGGYYATSWLLDEIYAFHVAVGFIPVILSALFIFLAGISTTSFTIYRAARANPVDTLRDE